ncbi:MAG: extensin family protein [Hyphomicrobiales bacterium]|nr:extensin family protein [Hyphomicrobiales bacterium]
MARRIPAFVTRIACLTLIATLGGCGFFTERAQRPAWRSAAENACLARKTVQVTRYVTPRNSIDGPGICGLDHPYYVTALANGTVAIKSRATLGCPMIEALDSWVTKVVQPAALARFGQPVTEINTMGSYACRRRNHNPHSKLSEHAFGNALDIGAFVIADGRKLKIVKHWRRGEDQERAFLRETHAGACQYFRTVLGPGSNRLHEDHLHIDLAIHGKTSRGLRHYCRPVIKDILPPPRRDNLPDPPYIEPDPEIARRMMRNRPVAGLRPPGGMPIGNIPNNRPRSIPLPRADIPAATARAYDDRTYSRFRRLEPGAPVQLDSMSFQPANGRGAIRADGVYVPPGH